MKPWTNYFDVLINEMIKYNETRIGDDHFFHALDSSEIAKLVSYDLIKVFFEQFLISLFGDDYTILFIS